MFYKYAKENIQNIDDFKLKLSENEKESNIEKNFYNSIIIFFK